MRKIMLAGAVAGIVMFAAGCGTGNDHSLQSRVISLRSELASAENHVSILQRELTEERDSLLITWQAAEEQSAGHVAALNRLEAALRREQTIVSKRK